VAAGIGYTPSPGLLRAGAQGGMNAPPEMSIFIPSPTDISNSITSLAGSMIM
jgi:hypothetical protein